MKRLSVADFAGVLGAPVEAMPELCRQRIVNSDFRYSDIDPAERDRCILRVLRELESPTLPVAGPERQARWEDGWKENLEEFVSKGGNPEALTPRFWKHEILRFKRAYIRAANRQFEFEFNNVVRQFLFQRHLANAQTVIEFGCGTGTSLTMLAEMFPDANLIGCDWATSSQKLLAAIREKTGHAITGFHFDMFQPGDHVPFPDGAAVLTLHAMEQLGGSHQRFLDYLLSKAPSICLHLEPIAELYDENDLLDFLAIRYHAKRGYLSGFLTSLRQLEARGQIAIIEVRRLHFGSLFHEANSVVVWKPLPQTK